MCQLAARGGRCRGCASLKGLRRAQAAYDTAPTGATRDALVQAHVVRASTPADLRQARKALSEGTPGPGGLPTTYWQTIIDKGAALAEREEAVTHAGTPQPAPIADPRLAAAMQRAAEGHDKRALVLARAEERAAVAAAGVDDPVGARVAAEAARAEVLEEELLNDPYLWPHFERLSAVRRLGFGHVTQAYEERTGLVFGGADVLAMHKMSQVEQR